VLVRIAASGLCSTDLEVIRGSLAYGTPVVLGHEAAGVVEAIGSEVRSVGVGDHVVASWNPACGQCFYCHRGRPILCEMCARANASGGLLDATSRLMLDGQRVHHFNLVSAHADYAILPEAGAIRINAGLRFDEACLIGCGVMTGYGAVMNVASLRRGETALIVGCGAVGLSAIQAARLGGADRIIAVDLSRARLDIAITLGATDVLIAGDATRGEILELTDGRGADVGIEAAGAESSIALTIEGVRPGGRVVILGKTNFEAQLKLRFGSLMGEKQIVRSSYGGAEPSRDFPMIAKAVLEGELRLAPLIDCRLDLAQINDGFEAMERGEIVRAVVTH
jgi:S-(hydroxymethyl)glutathione dehydrogenase/alcohol dehydrogenase